MKAFAAPSAPQAPALPADIAAELSTYDAAEPSKAAAPVAAATSTFGAGEDVGTGAEAFLGFLEADPPKSDHAHH